MARLSGLNRRKQRVRYQIKRNAQGRSRLSVFRSGKHIYAQIIDDRKNITVASASTVERDIRTKVKKTSDTAAAAEIGKIVAERAQKAGITEVVFDRGGYIYHGRVKALAEAARAAGLQF